MCYCSVNEHCSEFHCRDSPLRRVCLNHMTVIIQVDTPPCVCVCVSLFLALAQADRLIKITNAPMLVSHAATIRIQVVREKVSKFL